MKFLICALIIFSAPYCFAQSYKTIHQEAIVVDTHNDILSVCVENGHLFDSDLRGKTHSDLRRMQQGGLDVQVFSIFCDGNQPNPFQFANREIDSLYAWANRNPHEMMVVKTPDQLQEAISQGKLACMLGVEGGHMIEDDLNKLDSLYARGVRYLTLTWNNNNYWATSAEYESGNQKQNESSNQQNPQQPPGLNDFGKQVIRRMNDLGMIIDMSHVGEQTFWDAMAITTRPVIASHSNAWTLAPVFRDLKDDQIRAIAKSGGVIHLNFYAAFLDSSIARKQDAVNQHFNDLREAAVAAGKPRKMGRLRKQHQRELRKLQVPLDLLFDHMEYIIRLVGVDHVGLGGDFDGIGITPQQLTDVSKYAVITRGLVRRGYSRADIEKILGGNFIRVFRAQSH